MGLTVRTLSDDEHRRVFGKQSYADAYAAIVRDMKKDTGYAIPLNDLTARQLKVRMSRTAKAQGVKLRYGRATDSELFVELA